VGTILLSHAERVVTMDDQRREIADGAVLIEGNRITAVGASGELPSTADEVIDCRGMVLLPGLVNTHHHLYQSLTRAVPAAQDANLFGWLHVRADAKTGMWGQQQPDDGWLQVVNGFYRLTRGTYAQFGLPLPYPEQAVRTTLTHAQDRTRFTGDGYNACNVLDVIHPLWLAGKQTDFGRDEARRWAEDQLTAILGRWVDGAGFAFAPDGTDERSIPGLQGTEMWLSIIWLLSDYLGFASALGYRPRGVHRPEPLVTLPGLS
jgi:hypothetical protein